MTKLLHAIVAFLKSMFGFANKQQPSRRVFRLDANKRPRPFKPLPKTTIEEVMSTRQMRTARALRALEAHRAVHGTIFFGRTDLGHPATVCPSCNAPRRDDDGSSERITFTCGSSMARHQSSSKIGTYGTLMLGECADYRPLPTWNGRVAPRAEVSAIG